jgi:hypothetical protein
MINIHDAQSSIDSSDVGNGQVPDTPYGVASLAIYNRAASSLALSLLEHSPDITLTASVPVVTMMTVDQWARMGSKAQLYQSMSSSIVD